MNKLGKYATLGLMALSFPLFADKVVITGEPVTLEQQGSVYVTPKGYVSKTSYHYVNVDGTKRVCYLEKQTTLTSLDPVVLDVTVDGHSAKWTCYSFDETYFEVAP